MQNFHFLLGRGVAFYDLIQFQSLPELIDLIPSKLAAAAPECLQSLLSSCCFCISFLESDPLPFPVPRHWLRFSALWNSSFSPMGVYLGAHITNLNSYLWPCRPTPTSPRSHVSLATALTSPLPIPCQSIEITSHRGQSCWLVAITRVAGCRKDNSHLSW